MKKLFFLMIICFISCKSDIEKIKVEGVISNLKTDASIEGVELTIVCWYYGNSPDQSYSGEETKKVTTNNKGKYEVSFDKGAFIEIKVDKNGFDKVHKSEYINNKNNIINIKMKPQ